MSNRLKSMRERFHPLMGMFFAEMTAQEEEATWQRFLVDKPPQTLGRFWRDQMVVWFHAQAAQDWVFYRQFSLDLPRPADEGRCVRGHKDNRPLGDESGGFPGLDP